MKKMYEKVELIVTELERKDVFLLASGESGADNYFSDGNSFDDYGKTK